jgi:hypothetical protein
MTSFEKFQWLFFFVVLITAFLLSFAYHFVSNCIFTWPIRWDIHACWNEQIKPAKLDAVDKASNFMPDRLP